MGGGRMKRMPTFTLGVVAASFFACAIFFGACSSSSPSQGSEEVAEEGLATLRDMADGSDFSFFGYESEADVGKEEIGDPFEIKTIDADALLASETPTDEMIIDDDEILFPVLVRGTIVGSIRVTMEGDDDWDVVSYESNVDIDAALEAIAAHGLDREQCYLLDLEEIEFSFLGYESSGRQMLIPLFTNASSSLVVGTQYAFTDIALEIKDAIVSARASYDDMVPSDAAEMIVAQVVPTASATASYGSSKQYLNVQLIPQEQDKWCWAATGRMTMLFAGGDAETITQCSQADRALSQDSCCYNGGTRACNRPYMPKYEQWGFTATEVYHDLGAYPTWENFKGLINAGMPVAFLWRWTKVGGGHYMVAYGYFENTATVPATRMVYIMNPWPPGVGERQSVTYEKWVGGPRFDNLQTLYFWNILKN